MPAYIFTKDSVVLHFRGKQKIVSLTDPSIPKLRELLASNAPDDEILKLVDVGYRIKNHSSGMFGVLDNMVYVMGEKLPTSLGNRVLDFADNKLPVQPLLKFWENCKLNPDSRAKTDLYAFLEHNGHPITSDGCFMAYRYVKREMSNGVPTGRLLDCRTSTMDNSIGQIVKMDRTACDSDPHVTCSHGLHCAAFDYAQAGGDVVVDVKVNPKDVVAIPVDYNGQKMRTCEFHVISINEGLSDKHLVDIGGDADMDSMEEDEEGATSGPGGDEVVEIASGLDFSKPQDVAMSVAASKIDTRENYKAQVRDSRGHFISKGKRKPSPKRNRASKKKRPSAKKK